MGKSWGAMIVAAAAALPAPDATYRTTAVDSRRILATVLVSPFLSKKEVSWILPNMNGEVALFMVRDDPVVDISQARVYRSMIADQSMYFEAPMGGHKIVKAFVKPITEFVTTQFRLASKHKQRKKGKGPKRKEL
eukprot:NODE_10808_length_1328_cov_3.548709.p4 GENE.NODE_10808_length_1328_cov_3.548709~~NODE_10808_length_1328_cov_3.548709.p4  ORF type:complete len:135 (-),score=42.87 NODE_10808_length_1328_cov_3.548709:332-736(-)